MLRTLAAEGLTDDERDVAVQNLVGVAPLKYETAAAVADTLADQVEQHLPDDYQAQLYAKLAETGTVEATAAAVSAFPVDRLVTILVGDASQIAEPVRELGSARSRSSRATEGRAIAESPESRQHRSTRVAEVTPHSGSSSCPIGAATVRGFGSTQTRAGRVAPTPFPYARIDLCCPGPLCGIRDKSMFRLAVGRCPDLASVRLFVRSDRDRGHGQHRRVPARREPGEPGILPSWRRTARRSEGPFPARTAIRADTEGMG